jgi:hypothetical protein
MPLWGYTYNKPNVDLPPAHLLYAVSFAYDVLYDKLSKEEKKTIKNKLVKQARLMYEYFKYKPKKRYSYSQNHTSIPMAGLAIAAYALMDETEEAKDWAQLASAVYDRTLTTFAPDGYFYEGFHYFTFSFRWTVRYLDAHKQVTGEDLYPALREKFVPLKLYAMHSILPDRKNVFDFADTGDGAPNRNGESRREKLYGEYDILYRLASIYRDSQAQAVGDFIRQESELETREPMWAFLQRDSNLKSAPLTDIPTNVYFSDNDTVFWRSDWSKNATGFAFRAAPPEGHHAARLSAKIPDWRQSTGHAHPDANSFIIWANGRYLTGDTGYTGQKQTADHNTILVNERGQEKDGRHEVFKEVANERLDKIRIAEVFGNQDYFYARGDAASAYYADLGVKKFDRHFLFVAPNYFIVWDELAAEKPSEFSFLLNADREIKLSGDSADLINQDAILRVVRVLPIAAKSEVAPQVVLGRGLPGSVEKGESEQRGMQLITKTTEKKTENEFLHFLQISSAADKTPAPRIFALEDAKGVRIDWANGDREFVLLQGKSKEIETEGARAVLRTTKEGAWQRLILQNGTSLKRDGKNLLTSNQTISAVLKINQPNNLSGSIVSAAKAAVQLNLPFSLRRLRVNGRVVSFMFDEKTNVLKFAVSEGKNQIEIE